MLTNRRGGPLEGANISYMKNKGLLLYNEKNYKEALECFDNVLTLDPEDITVWLHKGNIFFNVNLSSNRSC